MEPIRVTVVSASEEKVMLKRMAKRNTMPMPDCRFCGGQVLATLPPICSECGCSQDGARY